jgi:hypothetical protein
LCKLQVGLFAKAALVGYCMYILYSYGIPFHATRRVTIVFTQPPASPKTQHHEETLVRRVKASHAKPSHGNIDRRTQFPKMLFPEEHEPHLKKWIVKRLENTYEASCSLPCFLVLRPGQFLLTL